MANTLSFQDAEKFIKERPREADALAFEAQEFLKNHPEVSPENLPKSVLDGKTISETYSYLREQHEDSQMHESGGVDRSAIPQGLTGMPLLAVAFLQKPKIMEDDRNYQQTEEKLKKTWLKNNPGKDFSSKEGLDYLYGSLDDRTKTSIYKEAQEAFRNNPKFKDRVEKYDKEAKKIYKKHEEDPRVWTHKQKMQMEINARLSLLEKGAKNSSKLKLSKEEINKFQNEITQQIHRKYLREFAQNYPEKTKTYHERIRAARKIPEEKTGAKFKISVPSTQGSTINIQTPAVNQLTHTPLSNRRAGGRINKGINSINKFMRRGFKNPLGKFIGPKAAIKRGFLAFLIGPGLPIAIAILAVFILTFIIVGFGGAPGAPQPSAESTTASPAEP